MGLFSVLFKSNEPSAIQLAYNNNSVIGTDRHTNNRYIIDKFKSSNKPLDILAVAISYEREGASYRLQAIEYFERFLSNPVSIPIVPHAYTAYGQPKPMFSYWMIYSTLGSLYERENNFEQALKYYKLLPKESNYDNPADLTRIGDILTKVDINQAVDYYEDLKKQPVYKKYKKVIDNAYSFTLEKQERGYKYKPRTKK